jgi:hypothetical protein
MKSLMSIPTLLTVIVVAGVIALIPLSLRPLPVSASSDDSETNTEQRLGQKNLGSGESSDFNCDENMIKSASGIDCIPSGPAAPSPPPPPTGGFDIVGSVTGTLNCFGDEEPASVNINAAIFEDGTTAGGFVNIIINSNTFEEIVNEGTTDGNTFSLSGESGICNGAPFTLSGNCGTGVAVTYEDSQGGSGTFTGDVACTPV